MEIRTITKIALLIFLYYIVYAFFFGIIHPIPGAGDSWDYHIPISQSILNGRFITLAHIKLPQWYYPGSSEAINALFIFFHIPLTLSNLFAVIILFFCCWKLALTFKLHYYYSLLFAITFCSMNAVVRWYNAVSSDVWVALYMYKLKIFSTSLRTMFFILILMSFIGLDETLSRSDAGHLLYAVYPSIITFFIIMFFLIQKKRQFILFAIIFYLLVPFKPTFYNTFAPKNIMKVLQVIKEKPAFFTLYQLPQSSFLTENDVKNITKILVKQKESVYIYPYDSYILNIENRTYNSFALGSYLYSNSLVEKEMVERLQMSPPALVILGIDSKGSLALDDIPNFTRNPLIAKWLLQNYTILQSYPKYILLQYQPHKKNGTFSDSCDGYQLTIDLSQKESIEQKIIDFIKPPLYYLGSIRLPYSPFSHSYLIFPDITNQSELQILFNNQKNTNCKNIFLNDNQSLVITRMSPFRKKEQKVIFSSHDFSREAIRL